MEDKIEEYIVNNLDHFLDLTKGYRDQKKVLIAKDPLFKSEIVKEFDDKIKFLMALEITRDLGCSYEDARIVLDDLKLETFLG